MIYLLLKHIHIQMMQQVMQMPIIINLHQEFRSQIILHRIHLIFLINPIQKNIFSEKKQLNFFKQATLFQEKKSFYQIDSPDINLLISKL